MIKKYAHLLLTLVLTACSDTSTAPQATAQAVITSSMNVKGDPSVNELILQQPEVQQVISCISSHLSSQDWTSVQHEEFMKLTHGGNMKVRPNNLSEEEATSKLGPVFIATADCM